MGRLLGFLDSVSDQELAQWCINDTDKDKAIVDFILCKAQGSAAFQEVAGTGSTGLTEGKLREVIRSELDAHSNKAKSQQSISISIVSNTAALNFVHTQNFYISDGRKIYPTEFQVPQGTASCSPYNWTTAREDSETPRLLQHHQKQLELHGVRFGPNGFEMYDVHNLSAGKLAIQGGGKQYKGIFHGCVAPYGMDPSSAKLQCRIAYEHKKVTGELSANDGQCIMELLATVANGSSPVLLDLTDGNAHTIYTVRGNEIIRWRDLDPTAAYYMQAQYLNSLPILKDRGLRPDDVPVQQRDWVRIVRQKMQPTSQLQEQLDSVMPFLPSEERIPTALELIQTWAQAQALQEPLPTSIQAFYT